ncbi:MAG: transcription antitermination factor NusB [Verrucomicrobia bacterium]|nr:transcription antitermination factor NusB [Verrucomicrobiota bacterium]
MNKVTGRRLAREWIVQFLFQTEFNPGNLDEALAEFFDDEEKKPLERDRVYVDEVIRGVIDNQLKIDRTLKKYTDNWDVDRLGALDRIVLRVAAYEMLYRTDVPPVVSINEAVEIAKAYSDKKSARFVNGVLDRVQKELSRPSRSIETDNG